MKENIKNRIFQFFIESSDFNGIPLRKISDEMDIGYEESIDLIKELVREKAVSIQSSMNPNIIGIQYFPIAKQLKILEKAKYVEEKILKIGEFTIITQNTDHSICLYPSKEALKTKRDLANFKNSAYTQQLALGEPQLKPVFFEIAVLERYFNDPRFEFKFDNYSGSIYYKYDENKMPLVKEKDKVFLQTFGLGFDEYDNRTAVVYLRYLKGLSNEHQVYWKSMEAGGNCKMLKEYHENTNLGVLTNSYSIFTAFIAELNCANELSNVIYGKKVFRKSFEEDNRPKEFTFFFTPTLKNYNEFVLLLDKMISDNINKNFFKDEVEMFDTQEIKAGVIERRQKGTLRLFEEWLSSRLNTNNQNVLVDIFKSFKKIRNERQSPAHKINIDKYDRKYFDKQKELMRKAYSSMRTLRKIFQQHPKARKVKIPNWLDNGEIKSF